MLPEARRLAPWLAVVLAALLLGACSLSPAGDQQDPSGQPEVELSPGSADGAEVRPVVRIALLLADGGEEVERGLRLAVQRRDGLVAGMPVEIVPARSAAALSALADSVEELISRQRVHGVVASLEGDAAAVAAAVADSARAPLLLPLDGFGIPSAGQAYVFTPFPPVGDQARALARYARGELGADSAAVVYDLGSLPDRTLARAFAQAFVDLGGSVPIMEGIAPDADPADVLARITERSVDVVLLAVEGEAAGALVRQARTAGVIAPILGTTDWDAATLTAAAGDAADGVVYPTVFHVDRPEPETEAFVAAYRDAYQEPPTAAAALAFDAAEMLLSAIESAVAAERFDPGDEAATRAAVAEALRQQGEFRGVTGMQSRIGGGQPAASILLARVAAGGGEPRAVFVTEIRP